MEQKTPARLLGKIMQIQKSIKTLVNSEASEKKNPDGKNTYSYTPGWKILEVLREKMDSLDLLLVPDVTGEEHQPIEYPVYKIVDGIPRSFTKKEMFVTVTVSYTWMDASSGEAFGPFRIVASGANGTDKSSASALALAERYFILKFFHIPTRDEADEPDAHDSANLTGLPRNSQPRNATAAQSCAAGQLAPQPQAPYQQAYGQQGYAPQYGYPAPQQPRAPQYQQHALTREQAVERLVYFEEGTDSYSRALNDCLTQMSLQGLPVSDPAFVQSIKDDARKKRNNG